MCVFNGNTVCSLKHKDSGHYAGSELAMGRIGREKGWEKETCSLSPAHFPSRLSTRVGLIACTGLHACTNGASTTKSLVDGSFLRSLSPAFTQLRESYCLDSRTDSERRGEIVVRVQ